MADKKAQKSLGGRARTSSADAGTSVSKLKRLSLTLGRKKSRDESSSSQQQQRFVDMRSNGVADRNGYPNGPTARNGFVNGLEEDTSRHGVDLDSDMYPIDGPLQSGVHSLRRIKSSANTRLTPVDANSPTRRFQLPLFGNLSRAASASQVYGSPTNPTMMISHQHSMSNPNSVVDLSVSPPLSPSWSPGKSAYMPNASRRQRRASLCDIGFGKSQTYTKLEKLGEGTYATVYKGRSSITGKLVALKEIRLEHEEGAPCTAIREVSLLKDLKHANIVLLHDIIHTVKSLTLIFEYVDRDLKQYMDQCNGIMSMTNVKLFTFQLLRGLAYCHARKVLHRDLKPQNLLISEQGDLKLADFGLARAKSVPSKTYSNEVVTLWYRPPDVLLGSTDYSDNIDMWGVGCILFEMACGRPMFPGSNVEEELLLIWKVLGTPTEETWPGITKNEEFGDRFPHYTPEPLSLHAPRLDRDALKLMEQLLQFQSKNRISASRAMRHSYFTSLGPRVHQLHNTVSIFTLPECTMAPNPGQKSSTAPLSSEWSRDRRKSTFN